MSKSKLRILDFYCHGGSQYEFAKTGHEYYLCGIKGDKPDWKTSGRPDLPNIICIDEKTAIEKKFDIVIVRSPVNIKRYNNHLRKGAIPIGTIQTTSPYVLPDRVRHVIWNSYDVMKKYAKDHFPRKRHIYIPHGFDPEEFKPLDIEKAPRVLTVANAFKQRNHYMGYDLWNEVSKHLGICDLVGGSNKDIMLNTRESKDLQDLIQIYNSYQIFWNTTLHSAMPRSRGEALMCGSAVVSTKNYDIGQYYTHGKDILYADNFTEAVKAIKFLLKNPEARIELSKQARETAIKNFHVKDYIERWNNLFNKL